MLMAAGRTETVSVTAEARSPIATTTLGQAFTKAHLYGTYTLGSNTGRLGALDVAPIWRVNSGQGYSIYADGVGDFKGYGLLDLAPPYGAPIWKTARPRLKVEFYNPLNNQKQIAWNKTVTPDNNGQRTPMACR